MSATGIKVKYTNWKGETRIRTIHPIAIRWGQTEYHKEWQLLLEARDPEDNVVKDFALKDCDFVNVKDENIAT